MSARLRRGGSRCGGVVGYPLEQLRAEVAYVAYHFHWSQAELLAMEHRERRRWVGEISSINERMNGSDG